MQLRAYTLTLKQLPLFWTGSVKGSEGRVCAAALFIHPGQVPAKMRILCGGKMNFNSTNFLEYFSTNINNPGFGP